MANTISTQELAETIAATIKQNLPIASRINTDLEKLLVPGAGDIVSVLRPGYGEVTEGSAFNRAANGDAEGVDINIDKVPVQIGIKKMGAAYDIIEKSLKLNTFETQVAEPYGAKMASYINTDIFKTVLGSACSSMVGELGFNELADAIAYVELSRVDGEWSGMLSPLAKSGIIGTGANKFANDRIGERLYKGEIGEFSGAEFFGSPDAGMIRIGTTAAQAFAFTANAAQVNDGDSSIALSGITFGGGNTVATIPAGTPIVFGEGDPTVPGSIASAVNVADVFGNDTGLMRTFVVTKDTPVAGTSATVPVAEVFMVGGTSGSVPNTYTDGEGGAIPAGPVTCPLFAGTKYYKGAVFAKNSVALAARAPQPLGGKVESETTELDGEINVRLTTIPSFDSGQTKWRMDAMYGAATLYGNGSVALYVQRV